MKRSRIHFSIAGKKKKHIACFLGLIIVCFISWRGYTQIRINQSVAALEALGFSVHSPVESRKILPTPWGSITLWDRKAGYYGISSSRILTDRDFPQVIAALENYEHPFELYLHQSELTTLSGFEKLDQLEHLLISDTHAQLVDISALRDQPILKIVQFRNAKNLKQIDSLGALPQLEVIDLSGCVVSAKEVTKFRKKTGYTGQLHINN